MQGKVWTILLNKLFDTICILSKKMSCATSIINGVRHILAVFYQLLQRQRSYNETQIGIGVKNWPSLCFTPFVKKPSNRSPRN